MRVRVSLAGIALSAAVLLAPVPSQAGSALDEVLRPACRGEPVCVIQDNPGGDVVAFEAAAQEVLSEGKKLVIDGKCDSACVILADIARTNTCLTSKAELAVHQSATLKIVGTTSVRGRSVPVAKVISRQDPRQSADIAEWVRSRGGYPTEGFMKIPIEEARMFWRMCEQG
jgi:hypothetical protein